MPDLRPKPEPSGFPSNQSPNGFQGNGSHREGQTGSSESCRGAGSGASGRPGEDNCPACGVGTGSLGRGSGGTNQCREGQGVRRDKWTLAATSRNAAPA